MRASIRQNKEGSTSESDDGSETDHRAKSRRTLERREMDDQSKRKHDGAIAEDDNTKRQTKSESGGNAGDSDGGSITIKILCSNKAVGQVIGRGGQMVNSIKESSGAHVKVSSSTETYPGTLDRIVMISGAVNAVLSAAHRVVTELSKQQVDTQSATSPAGSEATSADMVLTIALPASACGLVIGKGGERINVLREQCHCKIHMQAKDQVVRGVQERTITITGSVPSVQMAVEKIILLLSEDGTVHYENPSTNYGIAGQKVVFNAGASVGGMAGIAAIPVVQQRGLQPGILGDVNAVQIKLAIPESTVGTLVGKGGSTIKEIIALCGAQVKVSQKGEVVPGTTNRIVTITGQAVKATYAHMMVLQKVPDAQQIP